MQQHRTTGDEPCAFDDLHSVGGPSMISMPGAVLSQLVPIFHPSLSILIILLLRMSYVW